MFVVCMGTINSEEGQLLRVKLLLVLGGILGWSISKKKKIAEEQIEGSYRLLVAKVMQGYIFAIA